jgi:hypothetical protein
MPAKTPQSDAFSVVEPSLEDLQHISGERLTALLGEGAEVELLGRRVGALAALRAEAALLRTRVALLERTCDSLVRELSHRREDLELAASRESQLLAAFKAKADAAGFPAP